MLDVRVTIEGDKVAIDNLDQLAGKVPAAIDRALKRIAKGVHRDAYDWLSGPGRSQMKLVQRHKTLKDLNRSNTRGQSDSLGAKPGSYPVPVITGNLRRMLDWLAPGETRTGAAGTFTAGSGEVVIFDSAVYAHVIHDGTWTSGSFGKRPFLTDALAQFNQGEQIKRIIEEEISAEIATT